eukprot:CAMPEP_0204017438 /NCGR_PEP_ID=MMETSP0360-20130528/27403_1 /ASSEMBLY_ACC=CAM_ASM_000342 /TAXON_ID=268821 /ORGANISM="Scrippsiella Hangoei, Strain SHTV-5" /LENGTH=72 /DNA_ID=CAMNT_0050960499 /DNA_START=122 /DNA_END=336 /DNA_ORIENTATION=+
MKKVTNIATHAVDHKKINLRGLASRQVRTKTTILGPKLMPSWASSALLAFASSGALAPSISGRRGGAAATSG